MYNWYKNYDDKANKETFIDEKKRNLMTLIKSEPTWSNGLKEGLLFMVASRLYNNNNNSNNNDR